MELRRERRERFSLPHNTEQQRHKPALNKLESLPEAAQHCRHQNSWEIYHFGKKIPHLGYSDHNQEDIFISVLIVGFPSNTALHGADIKRQSFQQACLIATY